MFTSRKSILTPSVTVAVQDVDMTHEIHDRGKSAIKVRERH